MSSLYSLQKRCKDEIELSFRKAEEHYGVRLERVPVVFTNKMKKTAGKAMYWYNGDGTYDPTEIRLSNHLLRLNGDQFIRETPAHEAAHIIALQVYNHAGHGKPWKQVMRVLGKAPNTRHTMNTMPTTKSKVYIYKATCGNIVELKRVRHSKIQNRGVVYTLQSTGGKIMSSGYIGIK